MLSTASLTAAGSDLEKRRFVPWSHACLSKNQLPLERQEAGTPANMLANKQHGSCGSVACGITVSCTTFASVYLSPLTASHCCYKQPAAEHISHYIIYVSGCSYYVQGRNYPLC